MQCQIHMRSGASCETCCTRWGHHTTELGLQVLRLVRCGESHRGHHTHQNSMFGGGAQGGRGWLQPPPPPPENKKLHGAFGTLFCIVSGYFGDKGSKRRPEYGGYNTYSALPRANQVHLFAVIVTLFWSVNTCSHPLVNVGLP